MYELIFKPGFINEMYKKIPALQIIEAGIQKMISADLPILRQAQDDNFFLRLLSIASKNSSVYK